MRRSVASIVFFRVILFAICATPPIISYAQQPAASAPAAAPLAFKPLTVDRIYSEPSLSGHLTRGVAWIPDSKQISFFENKTVGKEMKSELWSLEVVSGQRHLLLSTEKLDAVLPADAGEKSQATGLGRHAPAEYQWAPNGAALLFQGPTSLAWFDLKTQTARPLVTGKEKIADPKISPDAKFVSFVRNHNLWLVEVADGKERAFTEGGTEEVRKGELDWVYPEELEITTAYWWAPDSSAIAYLQMDERKVAKYPLVDFESPEGDAEEERYPPAGGGNPVVRVFVAPVSGGEAHAMDTGEDTEIYIPRVNWLPDSKHVAIQRLNRAQTTLDLLIADPATGQTRTALNETDLYWINVSNDLHFLKDGKRFVWSSERSGYRHLYL
jgi:dipeptidyl-peptidase-4